MLDVMNGHRILRIRQLLLRVGGVAVEFVFVMIVTLRDLFSAIEVEHDEERRLHDSDLSGELNHRTGRLDSGLDPYGWYHQD